MKIAHSFFFKLQTLSFIACTILSAYLFLGYLKSIEHFENLKNEEQNLLQKKDLKFSKKEEDVYRKIFKSSISAHNFVPYIQKILTTLLKREDVVLEDIHILQNEDNTLFSVFTLKIKISTNNDQKIYNFLASLEKSQKFFTLIKSFNIKKAGNEEDSPPTIHGEMIFEIYTKP